MDTIAALGLRSLSLFSPSKLSENQDAEEGTCVAGVCCMLSTSEKGKSTVFTMCCEKIREPVRADAVLPLPTQMPGASGSVTQHLLVRGCAAVASAGGTPSE